MDTIFFLPCLLMLKPGLALRQCNQCMLYRLCVLEGRTLSNFSWVIKLQFLAHFSKCWKTLFASVHLSVLECCGIKKEDRRLERMKWTQLLLGVGGVMSVGPQLRYWIGVLKIWIGSDWIRFPTRFLKGFSVLVHRVVSIRQNSIPNQIPEKFFPSHPLLKHTPMYLLVQFCPINIRPPAQGKYAE